MINELAQGYHGDFASETANKKISINERTHDNETIVASGRSAGKKDTILSENPGHPDIFVAPKIEPIILTFPAKSTS